MFLGAVVILLLASLVLKLSVGKTPVSWEPATAIYTGHEEFCGWVETYAPYEYYYFVLRESTGLYVLKTETGCGDLQSDDPVMNPRFDAFQMGENVTIGYSAFGTPVMIRRWSGVEFAVERIAYEERNEYDKHQLRGTQANRVSEGVITEILQLEEIYREPYLYTAIMELENETLCAHLTDQSLAVECHTDIRRRLLDRDRSLLAYAVEKKNESLCASIRDESTGQACRDSID